LHVCEQVWQAGMCKSYSLVYGGTLYGHGRTLEKCGVSRARCCHEPKCLPHMSHLNIQRQMVCTKLL